MKAMRLAALCNKFMKTHQRLLNHLTILMYYLHLIFQDVLLQTRIYNKYSPVVLTDTCWTTTAFQFVMLNIFTSPILMLVPHFGNSCCLHLHATAGPNVTGMVERGLCHSINISMNIRTGQIMSEEMTLWHSFVKNNQKWIIITFPI
jgi:hypothetical protein